MKARIYKPAKTAMQSGKARTKDWLLVFNPAAPTYIEPLMGWTGSKDTLRQVTLEFASKEEAVAYAERKGILYEVQEPQARKVTLQSYADNFAYRKAD